MRPNKSRAHELIPKSALRSCHDAGVSRRGVMEQGIGPLPYVRHKEGRLPYIDSVYFVAMYSSHKKAAPFVEDAAKSFWEFWVQSHQIKPVQIHHLGPSRDKGMDKAFLGI